jgi:hypothetical protein
MVDCSSGHKSPADGETLLARVISRMRKGSEGAFYPHMSKHKSTAEEASERLKALRQNRAAEVVAKYGGLLDGICPSRKAKEARETPDEPWRVACIPPQPSKRRRGRPRKRLADKSGVRKGNLLESEEFIKPESVKRQDRRVRQRDRGART